MKISARGWIVVGAFTAVLLGMALLAAPNLHAQDAKPTNAKAATAAPQKLPGQLSEQELGRMLQAMGLKPTLDDGRYDFKFKTVVNDEEWNLSMSTVLSTDGRTLWVMAWLDKLPSSAADVPRTALLRLLADNDRLGKGKFFAYIAANRRFVLQRTVPNYRMSTAGMRYVLTDLGTSVVGTYSHWSTENWKAKRTATRTDADDNRKPTQILPVSRSRK